MGLSYIFQQTHPAFNCSKSTMENNNMWNLSKLNKKHQNGLVQGYQKNKTKQQQQHQNGVIRSGIFVNFKRISHIVLVFSMFPLLTIVPSASWQVDPRTAASRHHREGKNSCFIWSSDQF